MTSWGPYGRVRVDEEMASEWLYSLDALLNSLWAIRADLPNPSPEGLATIKRIRRLEKLRRNVVGTIEEKGWDERYVLSPLSGQDRDLHEPHRGGDDQVRPSPQTMGGRANRTETGAVSTVEREAQTEGP